ncbi:alpha-1,2-fucosyltransferase [Motilibacter aurantiacus]|uniref:alpha-1,2-fucosyltransferase n=1 Tax=Motilibacter aurantiacus TaxID=2714955 RepID=UPI00140D553F|nr:alpha-1,2-fucosyltransferase [Motilibacter aurantiacus]NHC45130.1 alpha-1,2-fucosyltransferase [Motilibacter aurantiacus]
MIATRLVGGLGNQMFQYAAGFRLARHHGVPLRVDTSWFSSQEAQGSDTPRTYALGCFALTARPDRLAALRHSRWGRRAGLGRRVLRETSFAFDPSVLDAPDEVLLDGYWQSERYFADVAGPLRRELTFASPPTGRNAQLLAEIRSRPAVSVHVRRGDYVSSPATNDYHGTCSPAYYAAALEHVTAAVGDAHYYVFSDDPPWCKENLDLGVPTTYLDHNPPERGFEDLRLMAACRHHVLANSSFSWWGAWLEDEPSHVVVAPGTWFRDASIDTGDLLPRRWVRLR